MGAAELDALFERPARPRLKIGVGAGIVLVLLALAISIVVAALQPAPITTISGGGDEAAGVDGTNGATGTHDGTTGLPGTDLGDSTAEGPGGNGVGAATSAPTMLVHVVGAVQTPGVFPLAPGARVIDAVNAAGGFADDADRGALNLARAVADGEQIFVPRIGETPPEPPPGAAAPGGSDPGTSAGNGSGGGAGGGATGLVNLNTASQAELETLPRIGPKLAQRIIEYREQHGGFGSVDELRNVAGIGDATFEAIAPHVTV